MAAQPKVDEMGPRHRAAHHSRDWRLARRSLASWQNRLAVETKGAEHVENGFRVDINQILTHVEQSQVMSIFFPILGKSLLIDLRHDAEEGPYVTLAPMAASVEDRLNEFGELRPHFGKPENMLAVPWVWRVGGLKDSGVLAILMRRMDETGSREAGRTCEECYVTLLQAERDQQLAIVKGDGFRTIWERK
ncbi:MAG: hypothetical protein EPO21_05455 [Chloroflexota bacterium]|nr:MAG: hypothetical protein EPO21_05455 [Chloroflexota bacterium]